MTLSEANKLQLQHKEIPRDISFYDQDGHKVHYTIKHEEEQNASYNDFYPIICQQGNTRKTLRLENDGNEHHVEDYLEDNEVLATMQDMTDCFKLGKTINHYKQLCSSMSPASSTSSLNEDDYSDIEQYDDESTDDETEIAELNLEIQDPDFRRDHTAAYELLGTKTEDRPILMKPNSFELFPYVDTSDLIQKLSVFACDADLDIQTLLEEQLNDPLLQVVRKWMKTSDTRPEKTPDINQSKALLSYYNKFEQLFIEPDTNLLCYREPIQDTCRTEMKICVPLSLFLTLFSLAHTHSHSGHPGIFKTLENIRQYFFWPGRYKWIVYLIEDCIECQTNKTKRHDLHEAPLEQWGELETTPFKTIHIDHKGPLHPSSNSTHCLVVVDAFSRFIGAYPVRNTGAQTTINALEKWITTYGIPQKIVHDNGSAFINSDFIKWTKEFGITLAPRTTYSPWTNGKVEVQNQHLTRYWRNFMNQSGNNWSKLTSKFAFAHNTSVNYTTGQTPYEIVFGTKPQVPMTFKLRLLRDKDKQRKSEFCVGLQPHTHSENSLPNNSLNRLHRPQLSDELLKRENEFKRICTSTYQRCRQITSKAHEHRNRFKLGRPISAGQKVFSENHAQDLTKSQKLKQLRIGPFTVTKQITNTTYEIPEDANPDNVKTTHGNHLIEFFPKEERLPPLITNYAVISRDSDFYRHLVNSQIEQNNSGKEKHSLDVIPFVITPIQNNSQIQQKENNEFSPRTDSGINSPASSTHFSRSQKSCPYENRAMFPLPQFQSHTLPMTPLPEPPNPIRDFQPSNSNTPPNLTSGADKGKLAHFATKVREKCKRNDPNSSLRKLERKGYKD